MNIFRLSLWVFWCIWCTILSLAVLGTSFEVLAQEPDQEQEDIRGKEEMLFEEIPVVFAFSKRGQPLTEAASTIEVVTAEDIKQSGATNLGDVLRSVSGVDVREAHVSQHVIGVRGFSDTGHVLVTLDGNNVFMYHANHIFLDWAPVDLEEIERVEIIKGPGAIFYGGNAFSGVINIITKTPDYLKGTQLNAVGGNWDTRRINLIHAGSYKKLDYNLFGGRRGAQEWEPPNPALKPDGKEVEGESFSVNYFGGKMIYHLAESSLSLMVRRSEAENVISRVCSPDTTFVALRYDRPDFWVRLFSNNHQKTFWNETYEVKDSNYELEIFRTLRWGRNITSLGGYAKNTAWEVGGLKGTTAGKTEKHDVKDYAVNVENEHHLNDQLILTLGARAEYYSLLDYLGLGRGSIIYKLKEDQCIRFSIASGYYLPSLFQHTNQGTAYPFAVGNPSLKEEEILSYELSYYQQLTDRVKLNTSIFYNDYQDLIDNKQTKFGSPTVKLENIVDAYQFGGELELGFILTDWLGGFANYAYQHIHRDDFGCLAEVSPEHKINGGLRAKYANWSANLSFHYVDKYCELYLTSNPVFGLIGPEEGGPSKVKSYTTVDARLAYQPTRNLELAIAGYNLFKDEHYESNSTGWHTGDKVGRRITGNINCKF